MLITKLREITHTMWITRNNHLHKLGPGGLRAAESQEMAEEIKHLLNTDKKTLLVSDQKFLEVQKTDLLYSSGEVKSVWIDQVRLA